MRCLTLPKRVPPRMLALGPSPAVLLAHSWGDLALHAFTANGRHLVSMEGTERLHALVLSPDGRLCLTGGAKGGVTLRWLHSLQARIPSALPDPCLCSCWPVGMVGSIF